jgi:hypothetical protein
MIPSMTHHSDSSSDADDFVIVTVSHVVADQGTIVIFDGTDEYGNDVRFAADHRQAQAIADALAYEDDDNILATVPRWAVLGAAV